MAFLETPRFPDDISYGSRGGPVFSTSIVETANSTEYRNQNWIYPRHQYDIAYGIRNYEDLVTVMEFFYAVRGQADGFRFKDHLDFKSTADTSSPVFSDQSIGTGDASTTAFTLKKNYTKGAETLTRLITRPVSSTTIVGIGGVQLLNQWTESSGTVTFDADQQSTVSGATSASPCEITTSGSHGLSTNDTVYMTTFTGDWAALNDNRYVVTVTGSTTFTIAVNTSGYTAYSGNAGQTNTLPQSGESVTAGFEFDVPVRFDADQMAMSHDHYRVGSLQIPVIELFGE